MRPYILAESTWEEVRRARFEVAVLPWGATEAHNRHLPYATDVIQCEAVAAAAARQAWERGARVVVLPPIPFGVQTGQLEVPLCLNMNPTTQLAVLGDPLLSERQKQALLDVYESFRAVTAALRDADATAPLVADKEHGPTDAPAGASGRATSTEGS